MSLDFASLRGELERRRRERLARRTAALPFVRRFDPAFLALAAGAALLLLAFWSLAVLAGWRGGLFDPPLVRPLPDERLLTNVRDEIAARPLLAAELHRGKLFVAQQGGVLHRYDPATGLWSSGRPFASGDLGDLVELRSEADNLWARSVGGGLARLADGRWTAIFGESAFEDAAGARPATEDLTAAALSDDRRWLLFGTRGHGVGLFDQERRAWVPLAAEGVLDALPADVDHVRWWGGRFWIGGPQGLAYLVPPGPPRAPAKPRGGVRDDVDGAVADLEAGEDLWVLETHRCEGDGRGSCVRLARLVDPEGPAEALIDENHRYPELDLEGLSVAQEQLSAAGERRLVVAGRGGLYAYDLRRHDWQRHVDGPVLAYWRDPRGGLYVGTSGEVARFAGGEVRGRWPLEGQRIRRILPGEGAEVLALTDDRDVYALGAEGAAQKVFAASWTGFDPRRFTAALVLGDKALFRHPDGFLVHDVRERSYRDFARHRLPDWLYDDDTRFVAAGEKLFALAPPVAGRQSIRVTDPVAMARGDFDEPGRVPTPVRATAAWDDGGLALIAGDGGAYLARDQILLRLTGSPAPDLDGLSWNDAALDGGRLALATGRGVRVYARERRGFDDWLLRGTPVERLVFGAGEGELRMLTADGRLARPHPRDLFLIGDERPWGISAAGLSDARWHDGQIYLGGDGRVLRYDPERRRLSRDWNLGGAGGTVRLIDVVGPGERAQPLAWAGGRAFFGATALDPDAGRVVGLTPGRAYIWTVRETARGGPLYLKGYPRDRPLDPGQARCLFRHPSAGFGRPLDARAIDSRRLAVATTRGLSLYDRDARSWYEVRWRGQPLPPPAAETQSGQGPLHRLGRHLALWTGDAGEAGRLLLLDLGDLAVPPSCASRPLIEVEPKLAVEARAASFDEDAGTAAWVSADGAVEQWRDGAVERLLGPPRGAPPRRDLRRAYRFGERLVFATDRSLFVYRLGDHRWSQRPLILPDGGRPVDVALEERGGELTATVHADTGAVYAGAVDPETAAPIYAGGSGPAELAEVYPPRYRRRASLGARPEEILDVQWRLGRWGFVLPDRLAVFDPETRRWEKPIDFPGEPDPSLSLRRALGLDVVVKKGGREWWIEQEGLERSAGPRFALFEPRDDLATAIDEEGRVWRLRPGGGVEACEARGAAYVCAEVLSGDAADPVLALEPGEEGAGLAARRRSGSRTLTRRRVELEPRLPPALDSGWLEWVREGGEPTFRVATPAGPRSFTRREFLRAGRLLFEDVRAVLAESPAHLHAATPAGVWTFLSPSLALGRGAAAVSFRPAPLGHDVRAAHGRFLTPTRSFRVADGELEPGAYPQHRIPIGDSVVLVERTRERGVAGTIRARGGDLPLFDEAGFAWDRRRGVAHHPRFGLMAVTGAGIHQLSLGGSFDLSPTRRAHRGGRLVSAPGRGLFFHDGAASFLLDEAGWHAATAAEALDGPRVESGFWTWSRYGGRLAVSLRGPDHGFALRSGPEGWQLTSDRLRAAAFHRGRLFVLSEAFLEIAGESPGGDDGPVYPPLAAERLESLAQRGDAAPGLYAWTRDAAGRVQASRWDEATRTFSAVAPEQDPLRYRDLVSHGRLRLRLAAGRVVTELRVDEPGAAGPGRWKRLRLGPRGFPFDRLTGLGAVDGRLLVHSAAGLQVYRAGGGTGLEDLEAIYDLGAGDGEIRETKARLGRPEAEPERFLVLSESGCFEWSGGLRRCSRSGSLDRRWLGGDELWRFSERDGRIRGFYQDGAGTEVTLAGGRFPHDRLRDLAWCDGSSAALWRGGRISFHDGADLALAGMRVVDDLAGERPRELLCVERGRELPRGRLAAGLYAGAPGDRYWRWDGAAWTAVEAPELRRALADPPLQELGRLRLVRRSGAGFVYQYRDRRWQWIDLPWSREEGRISIDVVDDLQVADGTPWAVTPEGLVALGRGADAALVVDPETLTIVREPAACPVTDFEAGSGGHAVVRCGHDSARVFQGELVPGRDADVFRPYRGADPFAERVFVTEEGSGFWDWRLTDRRGGSPGTLRVRLEGEPLGLVRGRFDFDPPSSLALSNDGVELVSDGGGWYRSSPATGLHAASLRRPEVRGVRPEDVVRVGFTRQGDRRLCVETADGVALLIAGGTVRGTARECPEDLGSDGVWTYDRLAGRLRARSPGPAGGWAVRGLRDGRLTDQVALGLPATGSDAAGSYHLVATAAGVVRFDRRGSAAAVWAPEHAGLERGAVPVALYLDREGRAVYVTATGVRDLESGEALSAEAFRIPPGARPTALEDGPRGLLRLRWERGEEVGWTLLSPAGYAAVSDDLLPISAADWGRFVRGRIGWDDPSAVFGLRLESGGLRLLAAGGDGGFEVPWGRQLRPLAVLPWGPRLFVIEAGEITEVRLDVGVEELFR